MRSGWQSARQLAALALLALLLAGCSAGYRYKVLSFFFDGVPQPSASVPAQPADSVTSRDTAAIGVAVSATTGSQLIIHPPYQGRECSTCHDESKASREPKPMPGLCFQCHEDFTHNYAALHGPVAGGQCTACHNPHLSKNKNLLIATGRDLCFNCHDAGVVNKADAHADIGETDCMECHHPHGGEDRYVLR